jgi:hypothetical protein
MFGLVRIPSAVYILLDPKRLLRAISSQIEAQEIHMRDWPEIADANRCSEGPNYDSIDKLVNTAADSALQLRSY